MLTVIKKMIRKVLNLKLVVVKEYQNIKLLLQMAVSNWSEEAFVIKKVKNTVLWTYLISDLKGEEIVGTFLQKTIEKKKIKKKVELKKKKR